MVWNSLMWPRYHARGSFGGMRINLGCGPHQLLGFLNLDLQLGHDLRKGLPVPPGSAEFIWSEHFLEHLTKAEAEKLLRECFQAMRKGGEIIVSTPDLRYLAEAYLQKNQSAYSALGSWSPRTPCDMLNEGMRLWEHQYLWDAPELFAALGRAGFVKMNRLSVAPAFAVRPPCGDLVVSAIRDV